MSFAWHRAVAGGAAVGVALWLAGCSTSVRTPAPVEERMAPGRGVNAVGQTPPPVATGPGEYRVKPGDTLTRIVLDHGHSWRDLARWNQLSNPDRIEVGQVLLVVPPQSKVVSGTTVVTPITDVPPSSGPAATAPAGSR